jgi:transcriptional regulator with XRE-family HTH domain
MAEDWAAVARVIDERMRQRQLTQQQVASAAQVALTTFRELQNNTNPRRRRPQTLEAVAVALGLPSRYLSEVLHGVAPNDPADAKSIDGGPAIDALRAELADLRQRVEALEHAQRG